MMTQKRLSIIGKGTAGCYGVIHFLKYTDWEIDWYYDPKIKTQPVGEGSTLDFPRDLDFLINFNTDELEKIKGTPKAGIKKINWGIGNTFTHTFPAGSVGYHFSAVYLQELIHATLLKEPKVRIIETNIEHDSIDSDFILDCSGAPACLDSYVKTDSIPVNSVHVTQCYWNAPRFFYTLTIARPYGWVFGIPLLDRCSIGYMYNNNFNDLEQIKDDTKEVLKELNLISSDNVNSFSFKNYYKKQNYNGRVAYNGNASFFLEPLEATSINFMNQNQRRAFDYWNKYRSEENVNIDYTNEILEIEKVIMLHYAAGSIYDTDFWKFAKEKGSKSIEALRKDDKFNWYIMRNPFDPMFVYGTWNTRSWLLNLKELGIYDKLR